MSARVVGGLRPSRSLLRAAVGVAAAAVLATGVIGFAHTRAGRPLLRYLPGMSACPLGLDVKLSPAERERQRRAALRPLLGLEAASNRPALGFSLQSTTRADVLTWAATANLSCQARREGQELVCPHIPAVALRGAAAGHDADDVLFVFDPAGLLVTVDAVRRGLSPQEAASFVDQRAQELAKSAGPVTRSSGERSSAHLAPGRVAAAEVEFRFRDYYANVSATQMGGLGLLVRERYQSLSD